MATGYDDPDLDPTTLNEVGDGDGGDDTLYLSPITKTSTTRPIDPDYEEEETSFGGVDETRPLLIEEMEIEQDEAWAKIRSRFPKVDPSKFTAGLDKFKQVVVKLMRKGSKSYVLFKGDDELNDRLPDTIKNSLGPRAEEVVEANDGVIAEKKGLLTKMKETLRFQRDKPLKTQRKTVT